VALAVCLRFDRPSDRALRALWALWDRFEHRGVPSLRSHTDGRHVPHASHPVRSGGSRRARIDAAIPFLVDQWIVNGADAATSYGVVSFLFNWTM
jgi:hypothetical protein